MDTAILSEFWIELSEPEMIGGRALVDSMNKHIGVEKCMTRSGNED